MTDVKKTLRGGREALGVYADIGGAVAFSIFVVVAVLWLRDRHPVVAAAVLAGGALALGLLIGFLLGRGRTPVLDETSTIAALRSEKDAATAALTVTQNYLIVIDDFLSELRGMLRGGPRPTLERLAALRNVVLNAVVQGVSSARPEQIRCAFLVPREQEGEVKLRIKYHQGHTSVGVANVALEPDRRSVAGTAFADGTDVYVGDAANDPRFQQTTAGRVIGTLYCVPVFGLREGRAEPIGVFSVASNRRRAFDTPFDKEFVSICANVFALLEYLTTLFEAVAAAEASGAQARATRPAGPPEGGTTASPEGGTVGERPTGGS